MKVKTRRPGRLRGRHSVAKLFEAGGVSVPQNQDERPDGIGIPDPKNEPNPPKLDDAGRLGPVGERKLDDTGKREKEGTWRDRPNDPPRDEPGAAAPQAKSPASSEGS